MQGDKVSQGNAVFTVNPVSEKNMFRQVRKARCGVGVVQRAGADFNRDN